MVIDVVFLDSGDKIKIVRKKLNIKQEELSVVGVTRNFISMIENGKRKLPQNVAIELMKIFRARAYELGVELEAEVDEKWLMTSKQEEVRSFCYEKLERELSAEGIDLIAALVKEYNLSELTTEVYTLKANKLYDNRLFEEAFTYYYEVLENIKKDQKQKAFLYNKLGKCKTKMLNYIEAITYFNKGYECSIASCEDSIKKNCLYNIAVTYRKLGSTKLALDSINELLAISDCDSNFNEYIGNLILKSNCYIDLNMYQEAINTLEFSLNKFNNSEDVLLGYIYNSLGSLYLELDKLDIADEYLDKAYSIRETKDTYNLTRTLVNKAEVMIRREMIEEALKLTNRAIGLSEANKDYGYEIRCYSLLEKIYLQHYEDKQLKELYLEMIRLFKLTGNNEEALKVYLKLLMNSFNLEDSEEYKTYLYDAVKFCN